MRSSQEKFAQQLDFIAADPFGRKQDLLEKRMAEALINKAPGALSGIDRSEESVRNAVAALMRRKIRLSVIEGMVFLTEDKGSGTTEEGIDIEKATDGIIRWGDMEVIKELEMIREKWKQQLHIETTSPAEQRTELAVQFKGISMKGVSPERIEWTRFVLGLLPSWVFQNNSFQHALRGGINTDAKRLSCTRFGHYDDEIGQIGIQPTMLTKREFIEFLLHEISHALTREQLKDKDILAIFDEAKSKGNYNLPMGGEKAESRGAYILGTYSEFLAESCMHYILGHSTELVPDLELNSRLVEALRAKVFKGYEYRFENKHLKKYGPGKANEEA